MDSSQYIETLLSEKSSLDPSYHANAIRLLNEEIKRVETGKSDLTSKEELDCYNNNTEDLKGDSQEARESRRREYMRRSFEYEVEPNIKLTEKVMIPVKKFPKFNFVGRLLGPKGYTLKRLQNLTGCKMSILGKGSMRDREKEKELLDSGDPKYTHLQEDLHVLIEVEASKAAAHGRLAGAISEVQKFLVPDPNDMIRQEQMRELAYLNGLDDSSAPAPPAPTTVIAVRGRGRARGLPVRGAHMVRSSVHSHSVSRSAVAAVSTPRHAATAPDPYAYEPYEATYEYEPYQEGEVVYYADYPSAEAYPPTSGTVRLKAPLRSMKSSIRESTYPY